MNEDPLTTTQRLQVAIQHALTLSLNANAVSCHRCGCTETDRKECIAVVAGPCYWVHRDGEPPLCSRCMAESIQLIIELTTVARAVELTRLAERNLDVDIPASRKNNRRMKPAEADELQEAAVRAAVKALTGIELANTVNAVEFVYEWKPGN